jgi:surface polysaccharide O-acyltransferase-like enzyme
LFDTYTSPTNVLIAMCYIICFSSLKINTEKSKGIKIVASATFGVYLIHTQQAIWNEFLHNGFIGLGEVSTIAFPFLILFCVMAVFAGCFLIERIRMMLFRTLRINEGCLYIGDWLERVFINKLDLVSNEIIRRLRS